MTRALPKSSSP
ncbi:Protein of unknown function [Pyronema omphalodes CBS 100304]|uniref:Uncharacterized protein n=1 Tax=Pyronema omphalodes (strain CBS 100304) TaxID=1076935 RepID=U4L9B4_PYROM|nr:Protein of unknown function [Pyronema omphalodes CBS 100304]